MKICPVGAESFHADRRTDGHDEDKGLFFRNFADAPKTLKLAHFTNKTSNNVTHYINIFILKSEFLALSLWKEKPTSKTK